MSEKRDVLRQEIRECKDIKKEPLEVPEWGQRVDVWGLTTLQRSTLFESARTGEGEKTDSRLLFPLLVVEATYLPGTEERLFDASDIDWLNTKSAGATGRIAQAILRLSGLTKEEVDQIKKG